MLGEVMEGCSEEESRKAQVSSAMLDEELFDLNIVKVARSDLYRMRQMSFQRRFAAFQKVKLELPL